MSKRTPVFPRFLIKIVAVILAALSTMVQPAHAQLFGGEAKAAFDSGKAAAQKGNWIEAYSQSRIAEKLVKVSPEILRSLAEISEQRRGYELIAIAWYRAYQAAIKGKNQDPSIAAKIEVLGRRAVASAGTLIEKAESSGLGLSPKDRIDLLAKIAVIQAKSGNTAAALAAINAMAINGADKNRIDSAYSSVASTCAGVPDFTCVDSFVRRPSDENARQSALSSAISALTYSKNFSEAISYAQQAIGETQARSFYQIAKAQVDANILDDARQSLRRSLNSFRNISTRYSIYGIDEAILLARKLSDLDEAMAIFSALRFEVVNLEALATLALAYQAEGSADQAKTAMQKALETLSGRPLDFYGTTVLFKLMRSANALNMPDIVARLLATYHGTIRGNEDYSQSYRSNGYAAAGRFSDAETIASRIKDANSRKWALENVDRERGLRAAYLAKAGRYAEATQQLAQVREKSNADSTRYNISASIQDHVRALILREDFDAAEQIAPLIPDDYYRSSKVREVEDIRRSKLAAFIKTANFSAADSMLAQEPRPGAFSRARIDLAKAYHEKGDIISFRRTLDAATNSVSQISLEAYSPSDYAAICSELSDLYMKNGDLAAAGTILNAAGQTIAAARDQSSKNYGLSSIVTAWARLLDAERRTGKANEPAPSARRALSIALQITEASSKASALSSLAEKIVGLGEAQTIIQAVRTLPASYSKDVVLGYAAAELAGAGKASDAKAAIALINDSSQHQTALSRIVGQRIDKGDWAGAINLASDPRSGDKAFSDIAVKMLAAGLLEQAAALEDKFVGSPAHADRYFSARAHALAQNGDFDAALKTATRQASLPSRTSSLFSLADIAFTLVGKSAAQPFLNAAHAQFAAAVDPKSRYELCAYTRSSTGYGVEYPGASTGPSIGPACAAEALALGDSKERISALSVAIGSPIQTALPMPGGILLPERPAISRWFMEAIASSDEFTRTYYAAQGATAFARSGAIEIALKALGTLSAHTATGYVETIRWLLDAGAQPAAQRIALKFAADNQALTDEAARERGFSDVVLVLSTLGDFALAEHFADRIANASTRIVAYQTVARAAVSAKQNDSALKLIEKAKRLLVTGVSTYYYSTFLSLAADAGDKNIEDWITLIAKQNDSGHQLFSARTTVIQALLQWKQDSRAEVVLLDQAKAYQEFSPPDRATFAPQLVLQYAWSGNLGALAKLVLDAPLPAMQATLLQSAANGFAKAGKIDEARRALSRSLEVLRVSRPDEAGWADYRIAIAAEPTAPGHAERVAFNIADTEWKNRAIGAIVKARMSKNNLAGTISLLKHAATSPAIDLLMPRVVRYLTGKGELDAARAAIRNISHPHIRDEARRQFVMAIARTGSAQIVLTEINAIEDSIARAYAMADAGAALSSRGASGQSEIGYFGQLILFSATKLADTINDPVVKADILATVAHVQDLSETAGAAASHQRAQTGALMIVDTTAREAALLWARKLTEYVKPDAKTLEEHNDWVNFINFSLDNILFTDVEAFIAEHAQKPASDASKAYLDGATKLIDALASMRAKRAKWSQEN